MSEAALPSAAATPPAAPAASWLVGWLATRLPSDIDSTLSTANIALQSRLRISWANAM